MQHLTVLQYKTNHILKVLFFSFIFLNRSGYHLKTKQNWPATVKILASQPIKSSQKQIHEAKWNELAWLDEGINSFIRIAFFLL
jgi:hypothetical protein